MRIAWAAPMTCLRRHILCTTTRVHCSHPKDGTRAPDVILGPLCIAPSGGDMAWASMMKKLMAGDVTGILHGHRRWVTAAVSGQVLRR